MNFAIAALIVVVWIVSKFEEYRIREGAMIALSPPSAAGEGASMKKGETRKAQRTTEVRKMPGLATIAS